VVCVGEWLKGALGTVYGKDGLIGISVVVVLILGVLVTLEWLDMGIGALLGL
jgi:hypothetical protein